MTNHVDQIDRFATYKTESEELDALDFDMFCAGYRYRGAENFILGLLVGAFGVALAVVLAKGL